MQELYVAEQIRELLTKMDLDRAVFRQVRYNTRVASHEAVVHPNIQLHRFQKLPDMSEVLVIKGASSADEQHGRKMRQVGAQRLKFLRLE